MVTQATVRKKGRIAGYRDVGDGLVHGVRRQADEDAVDGGVARSRCVDVGESRVRPGLGEPCKTHSKINWSGRLEVGGGGGGRR